MAGPLIQESQACIIKHGSAVPQKTERNPFFLRADRIEGLGSAEGNLRATRPSGQGGLWLGDKEAGCQLTSAWIWQWCQTPTCTRTAHKLAGTMGQVALGVLPGADLGGEGQDPASTSHLQPCPRSDTQQEAQVPLNSHCGPGQIAYSASSGEVQDLHLH